MWYFAYNLFLLLASPVIFLVLLAKRRCRRGLPQRLGFFADEQPCEGRPILWIHAVSLGEVVAVVPLVRELRVRYPAHRLLVTTVTETGREAVEQRLAGMAEHRYAPLDFPWVVSKVINRLNPSVFLFVETELWPNLLRALARRKVPAILVNGRLSSRSFGRYRLIKPFIRQVLAAVSFCSMQSSRDAERIIALGALPARVQQTGNMKFDQPLPDQAKIAETVPREMILAEDEELVVAGSTHAGEEEALLSCYKALLQEFPSLVLLLAPRHIERSPHIEAAVKAAGLEAVRRSTLGITRQDERGLAQQGRPRVIILDTRGELAAVYRHAELSFVGGTLVPVGGHNLLEPAQWGKSVFFGPYTDHCAEVAELLIRGGGGKRVRDGDDLAAEMAKGLHDRSMLRQMGEAAKRVVLDNQGAVERTLEPIAKVLDRQSCQKFETEQGEKLVRSVRKERAREC